MMAPALTVSLEMGTAVFIPAPSGAREPADPT